MEKQNNNMSYSPTSSFNPLITPIDEIIPANYGKIIWLYGRPSSGKTTLAKCIHDEWMNLNIPCLLLDGDELRAGLNKDLGFTPQDRQENFRRAAELAKLFSLKGYYVVCSFITPTEKDRDFLKSLTVGYDFRLIYVHASLQTCTKRDVKGLYKKALSGEIKSFTGISAPFDESGSDYRANTERHSIEELVHKLMSDLNTSSKKDCKLLKSAI